MKRKLLFLAACFCGVTFNPIFAQSDFALRINTGGSSITYDGETFDADAYANTGNQLDRPQTGLPEPYQTFRYSPSQQMSYAIPVVDGTYTVNLYFAELWFGATGGGSGGVGSRVFDVTMEGQLAEDNLDVFAVVGADAMLMKSHMVTVSGGVLNIDFDSRDAVGGERHPIINAIEILGEPKPQNVTIEGIELYTAYVSGDSGVVPTGRFINDGDQIRNWENNNSFEGVGVEFASGVKSVLYQFTSPEGSGSAVHDISNSGYISPIYFYQSKVGQYDITATPYSEANQGGVVGTPFSISFEIIDSCEEVSFEVVNATTCNTNGGYAILKDEANNYETWNDYTGLRGIWELDEDLGAYVARNLSAGTYTMDYYTDYGCTTKTFIIGTDNCEETKDFSLRINAGGTETTYNDEIFIADAYSNIGNQLDRPQTGLIEPYQSFRYSPSQQMSYDIPLVDGEYTVNLYFAELWFGATGGGSGGVGSRVFDVTMEGQLAEDNLDVFAVVGADAMLMKSHTVNVLGGILNIDFDSRDAVGGERHPIINAIEILGEVIEEPVQRPFTFSANLIDTYYNGDWVKVISIPVDAQYQYNYTVDWGDGTIDENVTEALTHTYETYGPHIVKISGDFPRPMFNFRSNSCDSSTYEIIQWGDQKWQNLESAFENTTLRLVATDIPDLSECTSIRNMFKNSGMSGRGMALIPHWDISGFTSLSGLFNGTAFNEDISGWDVSHVSDMSFLFSSGTLGCGDGPLSLGGSFNQDLSSWNVSNVMNMEGMFSGSYFNQDISSWDVSKVTNMAGMFAGSKFNRDISNWDVSQVTTMASMFSGYTYNEIDSFNGDFDFNQPLNDWDVSSVTDMSYMFYNANNFNQYIGDWDVSNVAKMASIFSRASSFNQNIGTWNVSKLSSTARMFKDAEVFNQDIGNWNVSNVTYMVAMFNGAREFNQDISDWDVSSVRNMNEMFKGTTNFNQDIGDWNVVNVTDMGSMFSQAESFNQSLNDWNVQNVSVMNGLFENSGLSNSNYDSTLIGWSQLPSLQNGVTLDAPQNQYCESKEARQSIVEAYNWMINDNGSPEECSSTSLQRPFITTWKTDNDGSTSTQITIPTHIDESYNYTVNWGDGSVSENATGNITHTYEEQGTYIVSIEGDFPRVYFNDFYGYDQAQKLISVDQWGDIKWSNMEAAFQGCRNMDVVAIDTPDLTLVNSMETMFNGCKNLIGNNTFGEWDVSNITNMESMFNGAEKFNQDISDWVVSSVTDMNFMFSGAFIFNQDIGNWDVSMVTDMHAMFQSANMFNQEIQDWDVSKVTDMKLMFFLADTFDQDIGDWDVSSVISLEDMFHYSGLSNTNYDKILMGWSQLPSLQNEVLLDAPDNQYCISEFARQRIIDTYGWTITDGGKVEECVNSCDENLESAFTIETTAWCDSGGGSIEFTPVREGLSVVWPNGTELETEYRVENGGLPTYYSLYMSYDSYDVVLIDTENGCSSNYQFNIDVGIGCGEPDDSLYINAGGGEVVYNGATVGADNYYDTGSELDRPQTGLSEPFQTFRYSKTQEMSYNIPLKDGQYYVNLYFAELWFGATDGGAGGVGKRVFDINMESALVEDNLDVYSEVGAETLLIKWYTVNVTDGVLNIDFDSRDAVGGKRHPIINAIEILPPSSASTTALKNSGASDNLINDMRIYPNQVSDVATLSLEEPVEIQQVLVFDMIGRLIQSYNPNSIKSSGDYMLDVNELQQGNYIVKMVDNQGVSFQKQMVVKR
ncbi:BspA family leucine-rich repeat surface protein [Aurantibacter sp.]|uniref:BspA family leucine-rich repeat surface protein n=1 Tax=Aurantibacter sp. TaxID=2807103 RepID=UPI0032651F7B